MSKKLPKSIVVFGRVVKIVVRRSSDEHGSFATNPYTIYIDSSDPYEDQLSTLFHELIHASLSIGGVSASLPGDTEEAVVRNIENGLWPLINLKGIK